VIDRLAEISKACDLGILPEHKLPIAIVGAGNIVERAHLPSYRNLGIEVVGIYDIDRQRSERLAGLFGVPRVYDSLAALLADERVRVVDIALPAPVQAPVIEEVLAAKRHVLAQKPVALDSGTVGRLMSLADNHGVYLCVNQQARFDEGIMATRAMLQRGWIGTPVSLEMSVLRATPWDSWYKDVPHLELWYHSIHEIDAIRSWFGTPATVWCAGGTVPGQTCAGETNVFCSFSFAENFHGVYHATSELRTGSSTSRFRIDGSEGSIEGDLGRFDRSDGSRDGRPDRVRVWSRTLPTADWLDYPCTKRWFLDAFAGPIGSLFRAVATQSRPQPDGHDNVATVRLIEALYASMQSGEAQTLPED